MFSIIESANELFGNAAPSFCEEVLYHFTIRYSLIKQNLPDADTLLSWLGNIPERDLIEVTFTSETERSIRISNKGIWEEDYRSFLSDLLDDENIEVNVKITKEIIDSTISIYCLARFAEFIEGLGITDHLNNFSRMFKNNNEHLLFYVLDNDGELSTASISFAHANVSWEKEKLRSEMIKNCNGASIFMQRSQFGLVPQDFTVLRASSEYHEINEVFEKLRTVLSFIYLANTANIIDQKVILQFDPSSPGYEYELDQIAENPIIPQIYEWAFADDHSVEKATIARKIITIYCHSPQDVLDVGQDVLNSIRSDYQIYQKNHAEKYIDMKNKISDFIVDCIKQVQEISHELTDAFRNNFVAIIVFIMTVLLTDTIDFANFLGSEVSENVKLICGLFSAATLVYLIVTVAMTILKWCWIKNSYKDLKANYVDVLVVEDIKAAFKDDFPIKRSFRQLCTITIVVSVLWLALTLAMGYFTISMKTINETEAFTSSPTETVTSQENYDVGTDEQGDAEKQTEQEELLP